MAIGSMFFLHIVLPFNAGLLSPGWDCLLAQKCNTFLKVLQAVFRSVVLAHEKKPTATGSGTLGFHSAGAKPHGRMPPATG
jgi:hypothetical protein